MAPYQTVFFSKLLVDRIYYYILGVWLNLTPPPPQALSLARHSYGTYVMHPVGKEYVPICTDCVPGQQGES